MQRWQLYSGVRPPEITYTSHILFIAFLSIASSSSSSSTLGATAHSSTSTSSSNSSLYSRPRSLFPFQQQRKSSPYLSPLESSTRYPRHSSSAPLVRQLRSSSSSTVPPPPFIPGMTCPLLDRRRLLQLCPAAEGPRGRRTTGRTMSSRDPSTSSREQPSLSRQFRNTRLAFCDGYTLHTALDKDCTKLHTTAPGSEWSSCQTCLRRALKLDRIARQRFQVFETLLTKVNCRTEYSRRWSCRDCKVAYKEWLCANMISYHEPLHVTPASPDARSPRADTPPRTPATQTTPTNHYSHPVARTPLPPCSTYCTSVRNRCPYFLPDYDNMYAGESSFLCPEQSNIADERTPRCHMICENTRPTSNPSSGASPCSDDVYIHSPVESNPSSPPPPLTPSSTASTPSTSFTTSRHICVKVGPVSNSNAPHSTTATMTYATTTPATPTSESIPDKASLADLDILSSQTLYSSQTNSTSRTSSSSGSITRPTSWFIYALTFVNSMTFWWSAVEGSASRL